MITQEPSIFRVNLLHWSSSPNSYCMDLHSSINYYWKFPLGSNKDKVQSSQRSKRNGERPGCREPRAPEGPDQFFAMEKWADQRQPAYSINYIVGFSRVIIPSAQKQKNFLAKLQPHCFSALTLCKKCWSFDFWCNHFYRERNNEDESQCCNMIENQHAISAALVCA